MNVRTCHAGNYSGVVLDLSGLDLEEIGNALADQADYEHRWLISPQTGEILFWTADTGIDGQTPVDLDELDLVCIDPLPSWVWYQDMADFADAITDERAGRRLARAVQGKGAFRRFRDELHDEYPDLLPAWYAFRDIRAKRRAVQWLADNSLIDDDAASRFLAGHPDPDLPLFLSTIQGSSISAVHFERMAHPGPLGGVSADQRRCVVRDRIELSAFRFSGQPR